MEEEVMEEEESDFYLPNEVLHQILVKLPVKSLVRFRCVSKFWNSRISKLNFFLSHYHSAGNYNVLFRNYSLELDREIHTLHSDDPQFHQIQTLDFPFKASTSSDYFTIIGCVNGLICLWDKENYEITIWNPAIRKFYIVPNFELKPPIELNRKMKSKWKPNVVRDFCYGFGYDALSNDFKVVRFIFHHRGNIHAVESTVVVFSLRRKSWRTVDYSTPLQLYTRSCNVGQFVYRMTRGFEIMCFDLSSEVFTQIECPDDVQFVLPCNAELINFRDSPALLHEWDCKRYHIWVMGGDGVAKSWTKVFSVDLDPHVPDQRIVGFTMTGKLLVVGDGEVLVSPVVEDVQIVKYAPSGPQLVKSWHMESFKESLFLLKDGRNLPLPLPNRGDGNRVG